MKKFAYISFLLLLLMACVPSGNKGNSDVWQPLPPNGEVLRMVAVDTMSVVNPFVLYCNAKDVYYMVGDGGCLWRSKDLHLWYGPYNVLLPAKESWMGETPVITSPEIHPCNGRYYYVAAFTNSVRGEEQTLCEIFVSDSIEGPYTRLAQDTLLLANDKVASSPTFCTDYFGAAYMLYSGNASRTAGEAIKIIRLGDSLDVQVGEPFELLKVVNNPWGVSDEGEFPVIGAPFMFATERGRLGLLFTARSNGKSALGVAYSKEGHGISGPWTIEPEPLICGAGEAMLFKDYDGTAVMVMHKDTIVNGEERQVPQFIKTDLQYDKLKLKGHYKF